MEASTDQSVQRLGCGVHDRGTEVRLSVKEKYIVFSVSSRFAMGLTHILCNGY
jgi:hypothetical protein